MKKTLVIPLIFALTVIALPGSANAATKTFQATDGLWHDGPNWVGGIPAQDGDIAVIPDGKTCHVDEGEDEVCDAFQVAGELHLQQGSTLIIDSNSTITDGTVTVSYDATLLIDGNATITGDGGDIVLMNGTGAIDHHRDGGTLTIEGSCGGDPPDRDCSLTVHGYGKIKVGLVNNAFVVADACGLLPAAGTLTLDDHAKSGSGFWMAECDASLVVNVEVTGSGTWEIPAGAGNVGIIRILEECTDLTGDVNLLAGTLDVDESFSTTGDLTWRSATEPPTDVTTIDVAGGKSASFGDG